MRCRKVVEVVVRDQRHDGLAARRRVHGQAFHVVDLVAGVGLKQRAAGDARAGRDLAGRDAAQAHLDALGPAEVALEHQQAAVRQAGRVGDVEAVDVLQLEALRLAARRPRSSRCDSRCRASGARRRRRSCPCSGPPCSTAIASMPWFVGMRSRVGGQLRDSPPARRPRRCATGKRPMRCSARSRSAAVPLCRCPRAA